MLTDGGCGWWWQEIGEGGRCSKLHKAAVLQCEIKDDGQWNQYGSARQNSRQHCFALVGSEHGESRWRIVIVALRSVGSMATHSRKWNGCTGGGKQSFIEPRERRSWLLQGGERAKRRSKL